MRIIFLTSDPVVAGLESDDGFTIGRFSSSTMFLVVGLTMFGAIIGSAAAVLRLALRARTAAAATAFGLAAAAFIGGLLVHTDGIDFRLLEPLTLTVGLFVLIPGAAAATGVVIVDRLLGPRGWITRLPGSAALAVAGLAAIPAVIVTGGVARNPASLAVLASAILIGLAITAITTRRRPALAGVAHWTALGVLAALTVAGTVELIRDVGALT
jgi:hypothetical protein